MKPLVRINKDNNIDIFLAKNDDKYLVCENYDKLVIALVMGLLS
jgi:hypothetical protein